MNNNSSSNFKNDSNDISANLEYDSFRFDVNAIKLERYAQKNYKKLLKKKFITG